MEEVEMLGETPNDNIKQIELIEGNIKYKIEIKKEKDDLGDYLDISVYNNIIKYKGLIHIYYIQYQLGVLYNDIDDIYKSIYILNKNKFKLIDNDNKYQLRIELIILTQKRYINIDLYDNINNNDEYINEIIKAIENKIKLLNEELNTVFLVAIPSPKIQILSFLREQDLAEQNMEKDKRYALKIIYKILIKKI